MYRARLNRILLSLFWIKKIYQHLRFSKGQEKPRGKVRRNHLSLGPQITRDISPFPPLKDKFTLILSPLFISIPSRPPTPIAISLPLPSTDHPHATLLPPPRDTPALNLTTLPRRWTFSAIRFQKMTTTHQIRSEDQTFLSRTTLP
jgi:hypothetical protein